MIWVKFGGRPMARSLTLEVEKCKNVGKWVWCAPRQAAEFEAFGAKIHLGPVPRRMELFRCGKKCFRGAGGPRDDVGEVWGPADGWISHISVPQMQISRKMARIRTLK